MIGSARALHSGKRSPILKAETMHASFLPMTVPANDHDDAWQLIRDDAFDRVHTDVELATLASTIGHSELLRRMLGMEEVPEAEARRFFRRVMEHRRKLSETLQRAVHERVAALDLMSMRPTNRDSRPIIVTPHLLERALDAASADPVTGLPTRAQFISLLRHELRQRRRRSVVVAFIDLDGMKRVNDTHGHAQGDEVLRAIASACHESLRAGDSVARIGGDEFGLLLLDLSQEAAQAAIDRLRTRFEGATAGFHTSFSAGIAIAEEDESAEDLIARADARMYEEKRTKRSR